MLHLSIADPRTAPVPTRQAAEIETIEYLPQDSKVYRDWLRVQQLELYWDRWAMMFLIGITVGICAYCLHETFHGLAEWKARLRSTVPSQLAVIPFLSQPAQRLPIFLAYSQTDIMREVIKKNVGLAWLFNVAFSCMLVAGSAASVLWLSPAAAGSGVPEVMAYLNGCLLPRVRGHSPPLALRTRTGNAQASAAPASHRLHVVSHHTRDALTCCMPNVSNTDV